MVIMSKSTPLAQQWAARHQAHETSVIVSGKDDQMNAEGRYAEFDDQSLYQPGKNNRFAKAGQNAYKAEGIQADLEDGLITQACFDTPAGRRAIVRLIALGYVIDGDFDQIQSSNREFLSRNFEEVE